MRSPDSAIYIVAAIATFVMIVAVGALAATRKELDESRAELACAITCNSKDVVVRDGKCGCIVWKEIK